VVECEQARDEFLGRLTGGAEDPWAPSVRHHIEGCGGCREELEALGHTWAILAQLPDVVPGQDVRRQLLRRVKRQLVKESILTIEGWVPAVLAAVLGVGLSLALAWLVPYTRLVSVCREALQVSEPHVAPYLLAGMAYGVPLMLGAWMLGRRLLGVGALGGLEASVVFLALLAPFVLAGCREFAPVLQAVFVGGMALGATASSVAGLGLARLLPLRGAPA
jgi:predicted anti-sigma-YlaC factor YlaD